MLSAALPGMFSVRVVLRLEARHGKGFEGLLKRYFGKKTVERLVYMLPSVILISEGISHGPSVLDTLVLWRREFDGKPCVNWAVSCRASASMAGGAGRDEVIPSEMLSTLTADTLVDWMLIHVPQVQADFSAFRNDERVITWCAAIRQLYSSEGSGTD